MSDSIRRVCIWRLIGEKSTDPFLVAIHKKLFRKMIVNYHNKEPILAPVAPAGVEGCGSRAVVWYHDPAVNSEI